MKIALGALNWTPEVFWTSTMYELIAAVDGSNEQDPDYVEPMTIEELEDMYKKFPDEVVQ